MKNWKIPNKSKTQLAMNKRLLNTVKSVLVVQAYIVRAKVIKQVIEAAIKTTFGFVTEQRADTK